MNPNPEKNWFGGRRVSPAEKTGLVRGVFDSVAERYDLMNDLMSGGIHRLWKDRLIRDIRPRPGLQYLDVAGGTGDIAFRIKRAIEEGRNRKTGNKTKKNADLPSSITICDLNPNMLEVGRARAIDKGWLHGFEWICGNAEDLPFPDNKFDVYTIAFGLRNVTHIDKALEEARRVLRPGGRFFCLEFSHVKDPLLARLYDLYSFKIIPKLGRFVARDEESYQYLAESIRRFPGQTALKNRMEEAGFHTVTFKNLTGGITAIHQGLNI